MLSSVFGVLAGCILTDDNAVSQESEKKVTVPPTAKDDGIAAGANVRPIWLKDFKKRFAARKNLREAWALFSQGGWVDAGQAMVYASKNRAKGFYFFAQPNAAKAGKEQTLTGTPWQTFLTAMQTADRLPTVQETSFDGIVYEYVHLLKDTSDKITLDHRFILKNPGTRSTPQHDQVIKAFAQLNQTGT